MHYKDVLIQFHTDRWGKGRQECHQDKHYAIVNKGLNSMHDII